MTALLREIARGELDAETRAAIEKCALKIGSQFTVYEGLVTKKIRVMFHGPRGPKPRVVSAYAAEELAALPVATEARQ